MIDVTPADLRANPWRVATAGNGCECWVNPDPWTYYGIPEPGDCIEYNPDCPEHGKDTK